MKLFTFRSKTASSLPDGQAQTDIDNNKANRLADYRIFEPHTWPEFFRQLFEDSPDGLIIIDKSGVIRLANKVACSMFGYCPPELEGSVIEVLIPERFTAHKDLRALYLKEPKNRAMGHYMGLYGLRKNGSEFPVNIGLSPINVLNEVYIIVSVRDITQQVEIEEKSKRNEDFLFNILESFSSQVAILDTEFRIVAVNKAWKEFADKYGKTSLERAGLGENLLDLFRQETSDQDETAKKAIEGIRSVLKGNNQQYEMEYPCRLNSHTRWFLLKIVRFIGEDASLVISHLDITQMVKERHERIKMADRITKIAKHLQGVIYQFSLNPDGSSSVPYASDGIIDIFGVDSSEVKNDAGYIFKAIHPDDVGYVMEKISDSSRSMSPWHSSFRVNQPSGKTIWVEGNSTPEKLSDDSILWHGYIKDITLQRRDEECVIENEKFLSSVFDSIKDTILVLSGSELTVTRINGAVNANMGYTPEELSGRNVKDLFYNESDYLQFIELLNKGISNKQLLIKSEYRFRRKDGIPIICHAQTTFLKKNDTVDQIIMSLHDVTDIKTMLNELLAAKNKAEESEKLKSAFLANVSHEIRTPLNGIIGFTELLKDPQLSTEDQKSYIDILSQSGQRMLNTINNLVDMSKIEAGIVELKNDTIDVNKLMTGLFSFFEPDAKKKGIELKLINEIPDLFIVSDSNKVESVLSSIIENAIKFTSEGFVEFGSRTEKDMVVFYVKDSGLGIPEDKTDAIFNPFVQADISVKRGYEGSGLGLSISRSYAGMLGGSICVESKPGKGSLFRFSLPFISGSESGSKALSCTRNSSVPAGNRERTVLIIEDDPINITLTEIYLKKYGIEHLSAVNGSEGVEVFKKNSSIGLVLMDIKLPVLSGFEATKEIRHLDPDVPIVAFTAHAFPEDLDKMFEAGCNDYLTKPFYESDLIGKVSEFLK